MAQKGSSRKGMRRRSNLQKGDSTSESLRDDEAIEVDDEVLRSYLYDVVKLPKCGEEPVYRVEGEIKVHEDTMENPVITPKHLTHLKPEESLWGNRREVKRHSRGLWAWVSGVVAVIFVSLIITYFSSNNSEEQKRTGLFLEKELEEVYYDEAVTPLLDDNLIHVKAVSLLEQLGKARDWQDAETILRPTANLKANLRKFWNPDLSPPQLNDEDKRSIDFGHSGDLGFYKIEGLRLDESDFIYYFVDVEGTLKIDWEASMNIGEKTIMELTSSPLEDPCMMRMVFEQRPFYLPELSEEEYESFRLIYPGEQNVVWGYVRRGSKQQLDLEKILLNGSGASMEAKRYGRATLKLSPTAGGTVCNRFFIEDVIAHSWVIP